MAWGWVKLALDWLGRFGVRQAAEGLESIFALTFPASNT